MLNRRIERVVILAGICLVLFGCEPSPVVAERTNFGLLPVQSFPVSEIQLGNLYLNSNKVFFWPDNVSADTVTEVSKIGKDIDNYDDVSFTLKNRQSYLLTEKNLQYWAEIWEEAERTAEDLAEAENAKRDEEAKPEPNSNELKRINKRIARLIEQKEELDAQLEGIGSEVDPTGEYRAEYVNASRRIAANDKEAQDKVARIMEIVQYPKDQPKFSFTFADNGGIRAAIREWKFDGDTRDFSSEAGTIVNLSYSALGGVFEFDVLVYENIDGVDVLARTYHFKFGRSRLDTTAKDGRIFFFGNEITRTPSPGYCSIQTRRNPAMSYQACMKTGSGVAKLCDKNNPSGA